MESKPIGNKKRVGIFKGTKLLIVLTFLLSSVVFPMIQSVGDQVSQIKTSNPEPMIKDLLEVASSYFVENRGQLKNSVRLYSADGAVAFRDDGIMFVVGPQTSWMEESAEGSFDTDNQLLPEENLAKTMSFAYTIRFNGANVVIPVGSSQLPFNSNFFTGNDSDKWRRDVPNYEQVVYRDLYDGIDLIFRPARNGIKYEFVVSPGMDPAKIAMEYEGIKGVDVDESGILVHTLHGDVRDSPPYAYQDVAEEVECAFAVRDEFLIGFDCGEWDSSKNLIIDPLIYSTYLGGIGYDGVCDATTDANGNIYILGLTTSIDFPVSAGAFDPSLNGGADAFLAKLNPDGTGLIYSTFFGGTADEVCGSITVDSDNEVYAAGATASSDFPTTPGAYKRVLIPGDSDAFVTKFIAIGSALSYSTFLGGSNGFETGKGIVVDGTKNAYVVGTTNSNDFPTTMGAPDTSYNGAADVYVTTLNVAGTGLIFSTYMGGSDNENGRGIAIDRLGDVYITGWTQSGNFPTTPGAFDEVYNGGPPTSPYDVFVVKLSMAASGLVYSTFIGGNGSDEGYSIATDSRGCAYVTGSTSSVNFPITTGAFDVTYNGGSYDTFVTKLNALGSGLVYSTYLGGAAEDTGSKIVISDTASAYVAGATGSFDFPVVNGAFDDSFNGVQDVFVTELNVSGDNLVYSTFFGGNEGDWGKIAIDYATDIYIVGATYSMLDFPITPSAFDTTYNGNSDAFVAKIGMSPPLTPGHRLISFPLAVSNDSVESVLSSIAGCFDSVRWYDPLDPVDPWKSYVPGRGYNDLTRLDNTMGFWINVTATCNFIPNGTRPTSTTIELHTGWNMVGFPSFNTTYTVADLKADIVLAGVRVETYDGSAAPYYLQRVSDSYVMRTGEGYWVYVPSDATWTIDG